MVSINDIGKEKSITAAIVLASLILVVSTGALYIKENHTTKELKVAINKKKKAAEKRDIENTVAQNMIDADTTTDGTEAQEKDVKVLFDTLFKFNDWIKYYNASIKLGKDYPKLAENEYVDTDGNNAGNSKTAPTSDYKVTKKYIGKDKETSAFLITQTLKQNKITSKIEYFIIVSGSGKNFDVTTFHILKEFQAYE